MNFYVQCIPLWILTDGMRFNRNGESTLVFVFQPWNSCKWPGFSLKFHKSTAVCKHQIERFIVNGRASSDVEWRWEVKKSVEEEI